MGNQDFDDEIDLLPFFIEFKKHIAAIILAAVIGGVLTGGASFLLIKPQYESTSSIFVLSKETTLTSLADLQIGTTLTKDYTVIINSRPVMVDVVNNLGLNMSYRDLKKKISIVNPKETRIIQITAKDTDPAVAKLIADEVANTASQYIADIMEMIPPKIIETGEISDEKVSPKNGRNALIGALVGVIIVCGVIVINVLQNDSITTSDDVAKYLDMPVLASIPLAEALLGEEEFKKKKKLFGAKKKQEERF